MNVCDTLSHSDTTMYHVYGMLMSIQENVSGQTRICTDRQTQCRESDSYITPPPTTWTLFTGHKISPYQLPSFQISWAFFLHQFHCVSSPDCDCDGHLSPIKAWWKVSPVRLMITRYNEKQTTLTRNSKYCILRVYTLPLKENQFTSKITMNNVEIEMKI